MARWTAADIPDQTGRTVLVTGANSGLGLRTAEALATAGARVLLACRSAERAAPALESVAAHAAGQRDAVRHQPPRSLRPHRPLAAAPAGRAVGAGRHRGVAGTPHGQDP